jgi:hypothetical protein
MPSPFTTALNDNKTDDTDLVAIRRAAPDETRSQITRSVKMIQIRLQGEERIVIANG